MNQSQRTEDGSAKVAATPLILVVSASSTNFDTLRLVMEARGVLRPLRRVNDISMALARVAGGGVSSIIADCSSMTADQVIRLRNGAAGLPVLLWSGAASTLPTDLEGAGAGLGQLSTHTPAAEVMRLLATDVHVAGGSGHPGRRGARKATVISVMGAKGGVGTTTVAMNIAAGLTSRGSVILTELRSSLGSLQGHFHPGRMVRGFASLHGDTGLPSLLWPAPRPVGLRILFGPQSVTECREIDSARAAGILSLLIEEADFVVVDLAVSLAEANRTVLAASQYFALVVEPTATCMRVAKLTLEGIQAWDQTPTSSGAVLVKRRPEGPLILPRDAEAELGVPVFRVIPPAPELCQASEEGHVPLVEGDPDSLAAESLLALSRCFHPGRGAAVARNRYATQ